MGEDDTSKVSERLGSGMTPPNPDTRKRGMPGHETRFVPQSKKDIESALRHFLSQAAKFSDPSALSIISRYMIQETSTADRISYVEERLKAQESSIKELESRINSALPKDHMESVIRYTKKIFGGSGWIIRAHYVVLHYGVLDVIFVHSLDDRVEALTSICKNVREIMDIFPDVEITPRILHEDEVRPDHLIGTTPIFEKIRESGQNDLECKTG